jgi:hypothetical protein
MAQRKTLSEQIALAKEDIEQHENKLKQLLQRQKEQERKDRTRRLIERGAILESLIDGAADLDNERIKTILQAALTAPAARSYAKGSAAPTRETATPEAE